MTSCKTAPKGATDACNGPGTSWAIELPGIPTAVSVARDWTGQILGEEHPHTYAAKLIVSELVTNAVLHSASCEDGGRVLVRLEVCDGEVKISVLDQGRRLTVSVAVDPDEHCRGLLIVEALAADCGVVVTEQGRRTWALIA